MQLVLLLEGVQVFCADISWRYRTSLRDKQAAGQHVRGEGAGSGEWGGAATSCGISSATFRGISKNQADSAGVS